jgi:tagatose 1,6-diphosphate aldolase GatY/KbaY
MLQRAQQKGYAIGAFNVENMEMVIAVIEAAESLQSPVILQTTPSTLSYAGPEFFYALVKTASLDKRFPIAIHLDHGNSFNQAILAYHIGYTSIMIDGSGLDLENNIRVTRSVVEICNMGNIPVEGELGQVGGKEDDLDGGNGGYTVPSDANYFAQKTGIDSLAVAIGTAHGVYKKKPKLDLLRLEEIRKAVKIPLVLHGTSGVPDETVKECIKRGICKVNYATDLRIVYTKAIKDYLNNDKDVIDPKKYSKKAIEAVKNYVYERIINCGSEGIGYR